MSPKDKGQLAHEHLQVAQMAVDEGRLNEAVNALFYAAEAQSWLFADEHGLDTKRHHGLKADAASELLRLRPHRFDCSQAPHGHQRS